MSTSNRSDPSNTSNSSNSAAGLPGVEEIRRVAELAALELSDDEVRRLAGEMASILEHFRAIRGVGDEAGEARGEAPGAGQGAGAGPAPLRADEPGADPLARSPEAMAPEWRDGFYAVPRLASHREDGAA